MTEDGLKNKSFFKPHLFLSNHISNLVFSLRCKEKRHKCAIERKDLS